MAKRQDDGVTMSIESLIPMLDNPRLHTERGQGMLARSLRQFGAVRGIVVDENFNVLAGNGLVDAAIEVGIDKVRVIEVEGEELVAVQVRHLSADDKARYAVADNRTGELSRWDAEALRGMVKDGIDLGLFFTRDEQDRVLTKSAYAPSLEPVSSWADVTERDVEAVREHYDTRWVGEFKVPIVEHTCPSCGKTVVVKESEPR